MKIDIIQSTRTRYGVLSAFTHSFARALERAKVRVRMYSSEIPDYEKNPPDFTLSLFTLPKGEAYAWDHFKIPHIHYAVDRIEYVSELPRSPYLIITVDNRTSEKMLKEMGYEKVLFLPHAADRALIDEKGERPFDLTFLATCVESSQVRDKFKKLPPPMGSVLERAVELTLSDLTTSYHDAFLQACYEADISKSVLEILDLGEMLKILELKIRSKDRIQLVKSIQNIPLHIFGDPFDTLGWQEVLEGQKNVILHPAVSFDEALQVLQKSRLTLNSIPTIKDGAHERIFYAYLSGALPATNENLFLKETFQDRANILFYPPSKWGELEPKLETFLGDEELRQEAVDRGREIVLTHHTWDARAKTLLDYLKNV